MAGCLMPTSRSRPPDGRRPAIGRGVSLVTVAVALAACGSSPTASSTKTTGAPPRTTTSVALTTTTVPAAPTTTSTPTTTAPTTPTTSQVSVLSAITSAVVAFETQKGVPPGQYLVQGVTLSTTDPTWAKFQVNAAPSQTTFQNAYGIAHDQNGWSVTAIGSSGVGCSGAGAAPPTVLQELGLSCP
jgi:hypothetical protein